MWQSLTPASAEKASTVWLAHPTCKPQLMTMHQSVGTGGGPVYIPSEGAASKPYETLLGKRVIYTTHCATLGDAGDIILADLSRYGVGLRREMRLDKSQHYSFNTDEEYWRLIARVDGKPLDSSTTTLPDGTEVAPFVTLAERA